MPKLGNGQRGAYAEERHQQILLRLRTHQRIDAAQLASELGVTGETVRKDLIHLERHGQLRRVHGGAVLPESLSFEPAVSARTQFASEKSLIARAALAHLPQTGSVIIDAGSTTERFAELVPGDRELTVFTNTLPVALTLINKPLINVFTLGGRLRNRTLAEVGESAVAALSQTNVDVAFLGTNGISFDRGLTTPDPDEAAVKRAMVGASQRRVLLSDHTKFGVISTSQHAALADIDLLITDAGVSATDRGRFEDLGIEVEIAE